MGDITAMSVLSWIWDHIVAIILILSIFFEISKIKINPISSLMKWLFKPLRKDMDIMKQEINKNIDSVREEFKVEIESLKAQQKSDADRVDELIETNEMTEISRLRWEIIQFSNSLENNQKHIRDEYRHIKDDYKRYHSLIEKYNLDNGIIDEEIEKINKRYEENRSSSAVYF